LEIKNVDKNEIQDYIYYCKWKRCILIKQWNKY